MLIKKLHNIKTARQLHAFLVENYDGNCESFVDDQLAECNHLLSKSFDQARERALDLYRLRRLLKDIPLECLIVRNAGRISHLVGGKLHYLFWQLVDIRPIMA